MANARHGLTGLHGDIAELMTSLEAEHHKAGWDNLPPTVYRVCRTPTDYDVGRLQLNLTDHHPRQELAMFAHVISHADPVYARGLYPFPPVSHILVMEMWTSQLSPEERGGRMLADIPGSQEGRTALAVVGRNRLSLMRIRGQEPRLDRWTTADTPDAGHMIESLALFDKNAKRLYRTTRS